MKNLIHISGIDQAKVVRLINAIADEELDSEGSITKIEILLLLSAKTSCLACASMHAHVNLEKLKFGLAPA